MAESKPSIFIGMPVYDAVKVDCMMSVLSAVFAARRRGISVTLRCVEGFSLIELARAELTRLFLQTECSHLLMIDSDMTFDADVPLRMLDASVDVIGCLAPQRKLLLDEVVRAARAGNPEPELAAHIINTTVLESARLEIVRGAVRASAVGTGIILITRATVEKLLRAHPERWVETGATNGSVRVPLLFRTEIHEGALTGEDFGFCLLCRQNEIAVHVLFDSGGPIGHIGKYEYRANLRDYYRPSKEMTHG